MAKVPLHPALQNVPRWLQALNNRCQPWTGARDANGYPRTKTKSGKSVYAHRVAYERLWGKLQPGERVYRRCGDRRCVCPWHLTTNKAEAPKGKRRRRPASAKLTQRKADEIRARWARPGRPTQQAIAHEFGVSRSNVSLVVRGLIWK